MLEIVLISIGLAMDAFAVSICKGLSMKKIDYKKATIIALYFGTFQAIMPLIGYVLGASFQNAIVNIDHWLIFILLYLIGLNMIRESLDGKTDNINDKIDLKTMLVLSLATSLDALAVRYNFCVFKCKCFYSCDNYWNNYIFAFVSWCKIR